MAKDIDIDVGPDEEGLRLDKLLAAYPAVGSRASAQKLIAAGNVTVGGKPQSKNYRVRGGDAIAVSISLERETELVPEEMDLRIPYEDEYLMVVDKPAGIVTHPAKGHRSGTLVHGLLAHRAAGGEHPQRPGIVHRLDRDTSGLLVVARDDETHRRLVRMLSRHEIERTYLALVHGRFETSEGTIEAPLGRDAARRKQMAVSGSGGKEAVTHFRVVDSWTEGAGGKDPALGYSLLEVRLETGRTHQIRVHLAAIGHPVAGDATYGRRRDDLGVGRQFLHSARICFRHPRTGEQIDVSSPLPPDLQRVLDRLNR